MTKSKRDYKDTLPNLEGKIQSEKKIGLLEWRHSESEKSNVKPIKSMSPVKSFEV